jgi:coenzyme F420-dependent glucose-6-phosphate dehydrogenase
MQLGYSLSAEEHLPLDLVSQARRAEEAGFSFALVSDHYHPWIDRQGQSPFVWSVLGGIASSTETLEIGTGVTCPLIRIHPAIVAQAAATAAAMLPGRFFFGAGTGENLNEHILGDRWPPASLRLEMLEEAVRLMRLLWKGELTTFRGDHYQVENTRIYTLPEEPIRVFIAASAEEAAELAGRMGDGLVSTAPKAELVQAYEDAGGKGPKIGQLTVCWAKSEAEARKTALEMWPNAGLEGPLSQELPLPSHFEAAAQMVDEDAIAKAVVCGPDADKHLDGIREFVENGFDRVYVHQVGTDQEGFMRFYERDVLPEVARFRPSGRGKPLAA